MNQEAKEPFNIMAFPAGPICNLNCEYCYYLDKTKYYPETSSFKMDYRLLEEFTRQYIEAQPGPVVSFGWQGGEPTLRGLDFFRKALKLQQKYLPPGWKAENNLQTNALMLDEEWCRFLKENNFLVGVSIDGPAPLHDKYRRDKEGNPTHKRVVDGIKLLQKYRVDFNILCVVHQQNCKHPLKVYNHFRELGADFIQFIPIVEKSGEKSREEGKKGKGIIGKHSVKPKDYGHFLISVFDEWLKRGYGEVYIQTFEEAVRAWAGYQAGLCVFSETCGRAMVMEHNGDLYSCDHFVYPEYKLGNIRETPILEMVNSKAQREFGLNKLKSLPSECLNCEVNYICHGGCLKNRLYNGQGKGLNYLCEGYRLFFNYIDPYMKEIASTIKKGLSPVLIKKRLLRLHKDIWNVGRNDPCPCGSGKKYKRCCLNLK